MTRRGIDSANRLGALLSHARRMIFFGLRRFFLFLSWRSDAATVAWVFAGGPFGAQKLVAASGFGIGAVTVDHRGLVPLRSF